MQMETCAYAQEVSRQGTKMSICGDFLGWALSCAELWASSARAPRDSVRLVHMCHLHEYEDYWPDVGDLQIFSALHIRCTGVLRGSCAK